MRKVEVFRVKVGIDDEFGLEEVDSGFRVERRDVSELVRWCEVDSGVVEKGPERVVDVERGVDV